MYIKKLKQYFKITIPEMTLAGILLSLYLISGKFIEINLQGIMHVGITFIFLMMFGILFGPVKGAFFAIISDTLKMLITTGIGQWMWEYEIISIGIPIMSWAFKYLFVVEGRKWWGSMLLINIFTLIGILIVLIISQNGGELKRASRRSYNFDSSTLIMIYIMTSIFLLFQALLFLYYWKNNDDNVKLILSMSSLIMMIIVIWVWVWGPIAYVRYLQRFGKYSNIKDHYTYSKYYKIALWARILKTPIIAPIYTAILIPLYKASLISLKQMNKYSFK